MSSGVKITRILLLGASLSILGCSVPPLESQLEGGPTVRDIVDRINCELATVINKEPYNEELITRINDDPSLAEVLSHLADDHFVASVLMTLDVLDTQGLNPSLNFIYPLYHNTSLSSMYNETLAVAGSLNGTQERNISLGYSIDLEQLKDVVDKRGGLIKYTVAHHCWDQNDQNAGTTSQNVAVRTGLVGDLGLTEIIIDGLRGLDAASDVNIYGSSGPTTLAVADNITGLTLQFDGLGKLVFAGNITFTPSTTDPTSPGSVALTGSAIVIADSAGNKAEG